MSPLCASEAQDLLLLKHRLPSSLAAAPDQLCPSCASGLCWLVCSNQTTFLKRRHCRFWLSFSFYLSPPLFFCFYRVLEGTYLASVRICPFQCEKADDDDSRKVGWWAWTRTRARTFFHTHTHILLLFFLICREQNSRGSKRPKARRGILIRGCQIGMQGPQLCAKPRHFCKLDVATSRIAFLDLNLLVVQVAASYSKN